MHAMLLVDAAGKPRGEQVVLLDAVIERVDQPGERLAAPAQS